MRISRRAALGTAFAALPRGLAGGGTRNAAPSDKVTLAFIGVGTQGLRVMLQFLQLPDVQAVAVCDANSGSSDYLQFGTNEQQTRSGEYKGCAEYTDYRELLAGRKDIDAVVIATPDHTHAVISVAAMRAGKHVFCQKPMAHSVFEVRRMQEIARETRAVTQVAIWNSASEATRVLCELVWSGAIGPVRHVHNWTNRPTWPQGIERPAEQQAVPPYLDWDLWLGPAPFRPYHSAYQPFVFRGWYDFGTGSFGDMGCYSFDTIFRALKLGAPATIEASSTKLFKESYPLASVVHFGFPARGDMPPVKVSWYDSGIKPVRPDGLPDGEKLESEGMMLVGDKGTLLCDFYGAKPRLLPARDAASLSNPPRTLDGYLAQWVAACKGGKPADANFDYTSAVTQTLLLGNVAIRTGEKLNWDAAKRTTGSAAADLLLNPPHRAGWSI